MKPLRFSFPVAGWTIALHLSLFGMLAIIPDLLVPGLEFRHSIRDDIEGWLLSPDLLVGKLWPDFFDGAFYMFTLPLGILFPSVAWACLTGLLWPLLFRSSISPPRDSGDESVPNERNA